MTIRKLLFIGALAFIHAKGYAGVPRAQLAAAAQGYATEDLAAIAALNQAATHDVYEYGGVIIQKGDKYYYPVPVSYAMIILMLVLANGYLYPTNDSYWTMHECAAKAATVRVHGTITGTLCVAQWSPVK